MLEGEVDKDNNITLEKKINNDKGQSNKMKFVGKIDLENKKIKGKAVYTNSLIRSIRIG